MTAKEIEGEAVSEQSADQAGAGERVGSKLIEGLEHRWAQVNGVRLHYAQAGEGPLVLFLHGFPQFWYAWRHQLADLRRDHLVVAPDMRGFNLSSKPERLEDYTVEVLVEDVRALVEHLGHEHFTLVGHDWGGFVAWAFALYHPELLDKLVILTTTHPTLLDRRLRDDPEQQQASQFALILRTTGDRGRDVEELLSANRFAAFNPVMLDLPFYTDTDRDAYRDAWTRPRALTGGLNYYRAAQIGPPGEDGTAPRGNYVPGKTNHAVPVPTLVIYAEGSPYVTPATLEGLEELVPRLTVERLATQSHWIAEECPQAVSDRIREFIGNRSRLGGEADV